MLKGYGKLGACLDSRLPITLPILHKILTATSRFSSSRYQICQFQATCLIVFYAFLREVKLLQQMDSVLNLYKNILSSAAGE